MRREANAPLEEREMIGVAARTAIAVAQTERSLASGVARAAMRCRWPIYTQSEPGMVRTVLLGGTRVLIVQLDEGPGMALGLISRLRGHISPVLCVAVDQVGGVQREISARQAGAAAYIGGVGESEEIERIAKSLEEACAAREAVRVGTRVA